MKVGTHSLFGSSSKLRDRLNHGGYNDNNNISLTRSGKVLDISGKSSSLSDDSAFMVPTGSHSASFNASS